MFCPDCQRAVQKPMAVSICPHCGSIAYPVDERPTGPKRPPTKSSNSKGSNRQAAADAAAGIKPKRRSPRSGKKRRR